ncbi:HXXXD-type acyl-transferase family protein [Tasmannia lanceolata]|uniref:HXXXD-type acyl-transferase family protein n=1 Tax=Tasmannia lanceolata TaxID=3420 RepID=UPI0040636DC0
MGSAEAGIPIHSIKISSVVPATVTGETAVHELTNMDLAMKLHYLRTVYFFKSEAIEGLNITAFKKPMFNWLDTYCSVAGRIRRSQSGRPFVKCNDSGVRIFEAQCTKTLDEWLEMKDDSSIHKHLVSNKILGPELHFSPLALLQLTWFKCGGMSLGFSWSHVIGDAFTAVKFINMWGQLMAGNPLPQSIQLPRTKVEKPTNVPSATSNPLSVKQVEPVGDTWLTANNSKMESFSFHISNTQLKHLQSKINSQIAPFEAISALIWQCLAQFGGEREPKLVTVCRKGPHAKSNEILSNKQVIITIKADFSIAKAKLSELAALIAKGATDESKEIEEMMEREDGLSDLIIYGANLTFVNLEEVEFYGLELKGQKPIFVNFSMEGVGDEGVVLVLPAPESGKGDNGGRIVTVILPENQVLQLKNELKRELLSS